MVNVDEFDELVEKHGLKMQLPDIETFQELFDEESKSIIFSHYLNKDDL